MIQFNCHQCGRPIRARDHSTGKSGRCTDCGAALTIPVSSVKTEPVAEQAPLTVPSITPERGLRVWWPVLLAGVLGIATLGWVLSATLPLESTEQPLRFNGKTAAKATANSEPSVPNSLIFAGDEWFFTHAGRCPSIRMSMSANFYTNGDDKTRLVEMETDKDRPNKEHVYSRMLFVQIFVNGSWVNHGPSEDWWLNGSHGENHYFFGKLQGVQKTWHPNGQLHIERVWLNDKMHGYERGWDEAGNLQFEAIMNEGKQVYGRP